MGQRHQQAARADEAGRFIEPSRTVVLPATCMHFVADIGAPARGGAIGEQSATLTALNLNVENEAGPRLGAPSVALLGERKAEGDDVARCNVVLPRRGHRDGGLDVVEHFRCP